MTQDIRRRIPYGVEPDYPTQAQAKAYVVDFKDGAPGAYVKGDRWAFYWLSGYLDVLTTELQENIYTAIAQPPAGFEVGYADDIEGYEHFRGWIFQYHPETESWELLVNSQDIGIEAFKQLRREYK